jgi:hypothetical protein
MKKLAVLTVALLAVALLGGVLAGEKEKEVTCQNVIQFKKGDEMVNLYIVKNDVAEEFGHVCTGSKDATVTGTVSDKDGRHWITPSKMTPAKEA